MYNLQGRRCINIPHQFLSFLFYNQGYKTWTQLLSYPTLLNFSWDKIQDKKWLTYTKSSAEAETAQSHPGLGLALPFLVCNADDTQMQYLHVIDTMSNFTNLERSCKVNRRNLSAVEKTRTSSFQHERRLSKRVALCLSIKLGKLCLNTGLPF